MEKIIILFVGVLLLIGQYFWVQKFGKSILTSIIYVIAYLVVALSCFIIVFQSPDVFKDYVGYQAAMCVSLFSPKVIDFFLGMIYGKNEEKQNVLA